MGKIVFVPQAQDLVVVEIEQFGGHMLPHVPVAEKHIPPPKMAVLDGRARPFHAQIAPLIHLRHSAALGSDEIIIPAYVSRKVSVAENLTRELWVIRDRG